MYPRHHACIDPQALALLVRRCNGLPLLGSDFWHWLSVVNSNFLSKRDSLLSTFTAIRSFCCEQFLLVRKKLLVSGQSRRTSCVSPIAITRGLVKSTKLLSSSLPLAGGSAAGWPDCQTWKGLCGFISVSYFSSHLDISVCSAK